MNMVVVMTAAALVVALLAFSTRWYIKRASRISEANNERQGFSNELLLRLKDIRDNDNGDLATALDEIIDIAKYETPVSNERTYDLDSSICSQLSAVREKPTFENVAKLKSMLVSRNRRAVR